MKWLNLICILLVQSFLGAKDFEGLTLDTTYEISQGQEEGQLGFWVPGAGLESITPGEAWAGSNEILINDRLNGRINLYNRNFQIQNTWKYPDGIFISAAPLVRRFDNGDFLSADQHYLKRVTENGVLIYNVNVEALGKSIPRGDFWLYKDYLVFYSDNGQKQAVNTKGDLLPKKETDLLAETMLQDSVFASDNKISSFIREFCKERDLFYMKDKIITTDYTHFDIFYRKIRELKGLDVKDVPPQMGVYTLDGHDIRGVSYWIFKKEGSSQFLYKAFNTLGEEILHTSSDSFVDLLITPWGDHYLATMDEDAGKCTFTRFIIDE